MKVSSNISDFKNKKCIISVGMFDGVHKGHQFFLESFIELAEKLNVVPILIGLYPHPRKFLHSIDFKCLTSIEERSNLLFNYDIENYLVLDSTADLLSKSASEFLDYLTENGLDVQAVAMGFNNRFGKTIAGELSFDEQIRAKGIKFYRVSPYTEKVSSTLIREAIEQGRIEYANSMLGYNYGITGTVVTGNKIGRQIGFPTANVVVDISEKLLPKNGVYAVEIEYKNRRYPAMMNIGYRPTIIEAQKQLFLEVHVINQSIELYDENLQLFFVKRIREEKQFSSLEELKAQLIKDKDFIIQYFNCNFDNSKNI